jgi:hypothetical protein
MDIETSVYDGSRRPSVPEYHGQDYERSIR